MKTSVRFLLLIVALVSWPLIASAQQAITTINAHTCTPDPDYLDLINYTSVGIQFKSGATGFMQFYCPLPTIEHYDYVEVMELVYTDTDGTADNSRVFAETRRVVDLGSVVRVGDLADSNNSEVTGLNRIRVTINFTYPNYQQPFNLEESSYYVRVGMRRETTAQDPEFRAVRIMNISYLDDI